MTFDVYCWITTIIMMISLLTAMEFYKNVLKRRGILKEFHDYVVIYVAICLISVMAPLVIPVILTLGLFIGIAKLLNRIISHFIKVE